MREPVAQITLRVPVATEERLERFCSRYGISRRAAFEAVTQIALDDEEDPARRQWILEVWAACRRLEEAGAFRIEPRRKIIARLEPDLAARLKEACQRHGVSQNAALAMPVTSWPEKETPIFVQQRLNLGNRVVARARHLDHERRRGQAVRQQSPEEAEDGPKNHPGRIFDSFGSLLTRALCFSTLAGFA